MLNNFNRSLELIDGFETNYIRLLYYDLPKNYKGTYKSYEYSRFCTILNGEKEVTLNNLKQMTYDTNKYLLLPSHSLVEMKIKEPTRALVFEFNDSIISDVSDKVPFNLDFQSELPPLEDQLFMGDLEAPLSRNILDIIKAHHHLSQHKEFLIDLYAQELVYHLMKTEGTRHILSYETHHPVHVAVKYMIAHVNSTIHLKTLAHDLNMSESNFSNLFKKVIGISPRDYIKNLKLLKAKEYLKTLSVTETSYTLGYSNISYFIKLFKAKYGKTPKQYKLDLYQDPPT